MLAYSLNLEKVTTSDRLSQSLQRGNLHQVTFLKGDKEDKMFIEANPQFKSLNIYDSNMKKVFQENERKEQKVDNGKEVSASKETQKQSAAVEEPDEALTSEKKQPRKKMKV